MDAQSILAKLRHGIALDREELRWFAMELAKDTIDDAQAGAFAMGICTFPLDLQARIDLTLAMRDSGTQLHWDLPGPVVDKHSTGGIGDCVSLILGPALAALGVYVPMLSGRGLGHTGGTLDKLEAIPGLSCDMDTKKFQRVVAETGCALVAANTDIAPADRRLYAIRDVTSTVDSIDLITASILSKKLAGGVGPLVLDVKVGTGAFMSSLVEAEALANSLVETANGASGPAGALITDMNQPCVGSVGNALEIMEVMKALTDPDDDAIVIHLVAELGGEVMRLAGMADHRREGAEQIMDVVATGAAADRFGRMVAAKGGPADFVERWRDRLPAAPVVREVVAQRAGTIAAIDGRALGMGVVHLGGGRRRAGDRIDPSVGLSDVVGLGDEIEAGDPLAIVHAASEGEADHIAAELAAAFSLGEGIIDAPPVIYKAIS